MTELNDCLEEISIPKPSEVAEILRELAPELCHHIETIEAFGDYISHANDLKEIRVHPRQEMKAKLWINPPYIMLCNEILPLPKWELFIDPTVPEYEMHLIYIDGHREIIGM